MSSVSFSFRFIDAMLFFHDIVASPIFHIRQLHMPAKRIFYFKFFLAGRVTFIESSEDPRKELID